MLDDADTRRLKRLRRWAGRLGLSVKSVRGARGVAVGFHIRDERGRLVGQPCVLTLDEIEKEFLRLEKKRL